MIILKHDVTDPKETPTLTFASFSPNEDGTVCLVMPDGSFATQEPGGYGVFRPGGADVRGAYQRARVNGQLVTFWTRPQDQPYTYTWVELPN
jgi:hypothetical protein